MSAPSPPTVDHQTTSCDLCIIGAGYAGINAFNAACKYLPPGARVVIVDRGKEWGGQWVEQYNYVRLQPYTQFTAGERTWAISGTYPESHLATKGEILEHIRDVARLCVEENGIDLSLLFRYEYSGGYEVRGDGKVWLTATPVQGPQQHGASSGAYPAVTPVPVTIVADKMINARGFDVPTKQRLRFSCCQEETMATAMGGARVVQHQPVVQGSSFSPPTAPFSPPLSPPSSLVSRPPSVPRRRVHSLVPGDVLTAEWTVRREREGGGGERRRERERERERDSPL
jgi:hypothetical protein